MKDRKFTFDSENLAFPEIHTGKVKQNDVAEDNTDSTVVYDTVAVPEVHLKKHKHPLPPHQVPRRARDLRQ